MQSSVTLINGFAVLRDKEDEFMQLCNQTAHLMKQKPGFMDTKLHRSLNAGTRFQFVNIAHWENQETWQQAIASNPELQNWWSRIALLAEASPALYKVEVQD
ncbi:MAG TPA: antibiotic biosynthesis monooxygenase [Candidatus Caenarcaniphilales bacterium]